MVLVVGSEVIC